MKRSVKCLCVRAAFACWALGAVVCQGETQLLEDPSAGFDFVVQGFGQEPSLASVRLVNPESGQGVAGIHLGGVDLSGYAKGRFAVDFQTGPENGADQFVVQLIDADGAKGNWVFTVSGAEPGEPQSLVSRSTLDAPGLPAGQSAAPDLSRIKTFQVVGHYGSPARFDVSFGSVRITNDESPPAPYAGYELDAAWRAEAAERIERLRKVDVLVSVVDAGGAPMPGARVQVQQTRHAFGFGSAVQAWRFGEATSNAAYREKFERLFNVATIENNLKWPAWEGEWGDTYSKENALRALGWLADRGIAARGHVMVWPGRDHLPADLKRLVESRTLGAPEQQKVRERVRSHVLELAEATEGQVAAWDVVNEPRANHDLMDGLPEGDRAMADWFKLARQAAPGAKLLLNEYGILSSGGGVGTSNQRLLEDQLKALISASAPIDAVGLQAHFSEGNLTGPKQLWRILDRYASLGLEVQVTEFDFATSDEQLQADFTRDFLTAVFAHGAVSMIVQWGFWEDAHYNGQAALFRSDWSTKPNGQAYEDLVLGEWWTDESFVTESADATSVSAFKGTHRLTASFGGEEVVEEAELLRSGAILGLKLPVLLGDYNRDGKVDAVDYTVCRDQKGSRVDPPGSGADGNADGVVDKADEAIWRANFGRSATPE